MKKNEKGIFARKLEHLFKTIRKPDGSEYSEVEVEVETTRRGEKITSTYVRRLREGKSRNPSYEKIKALAHFFGVDPAYFFEEEDDDDAPEQTVADYPEPVKMPLDSFDLDSIAMRAEEIEDNAAKDAVLRMLLAIKETRAQLGEGQTPTQPSGKDMSAFQMS